MKLLIIQTGTALGPVRERHGDFPLWFRRGLGLAADRVTSVRVDAGQALPPAHSIGAAVITGSGAMVSERLDWSERTADWLRSATHTGLPMLGVCYGHQLLAHALGGCSDYNPRGREIGTVSIQCLPAAKNDALFGALPASFPAHATHLQTVISLPPAAVVLARSSLDECQAVRFAPRVWGVQFHPEFNKAHMRAYLSARQEAVSAEGLDARQLLRDVGTSPQARSLLRGFVRVASEAQ